MGRPTDLRSSPARAVLAVAVLLLCAWWAPGASAEPVLDDQVVAATTADAERPSAAARRRRRFRSALGRLGRPRAGGVFGATGVSGAPAVGWIDPYLERGPPLTLA